MARKISLPVSVVSLLVCLMAPVLYFVGEISMERYKLIFLLASVVWFASATLWSSRKGAGAAGG